MPDPIPYPEFTEPFLRTAEVVLDESGGANDEGEIDPTDFTAQNVPVVVEKLILFENSLRDPAQDPGADTQLLSDITGRWWFVRNHDNSLPEMPLTAWDDGTLDRTIPVVHGMQEPEDWATVAMDLRRSPIIVPRNGALRCDWQNPTKTSAGAVPAGVLHLAATCRMRTRRRPVMLYLPVSFLASAGGAADGPSGMQDEQTSSRNQSGEELELTELRMYFDGDYGAAVPWADTRIFRHLLVRPFIEPGDIGLCAAGNKVAVVGHGSSRQLDHTVVNVDWAREPVLLDDSDGIGFKFTNGSATKTRMTVVQVCRRIPTR